MRSKPNPAFYRKLGDEGMVHLYSIWTEQLFDHRKIEDASAQCITLYDGFVTCGEYNRGSIERRFLEMAYSRYNLKKNTNCGLFYRHPISQTTNDVLSRLNVTAQLP